MGKKDGKKFNQKAANLDHRGRPKSGRGKGMRIPKFAELMAGLGS
jgi:hypothetical protein